MATIEAIQQPGKPRACAERVADRCAWTLPLPRFQLRCCGRDGQTIFIKNASRTFIMSEVNHEQGENLPTPQPPERASRWCRELYL
jgi:hypothetical protein